MLSNAGLLLAAVVVVLVWVKAEPLYYINHSIEKYQQEISGS